MPAVSEAQQRLFYAALHHKLHNGPGNERIQRLAELPEETLRDFTILNNRPYDPATAPKFPAHKNGGPAPDARMRKLLQEALQKRKISSNTRLKELPEDIHTKLQSIYGVTLAKEDLSQVKKVQHLQHLIRNGHRTASAGTNPRPRSSTPATHQTSPQSSESSFLQHLRNLWQRLFNPSHGPLSNLQ